MSKSTPPKPPAWTRIAVTTRYENGTEMTYAVESPYDDLTTDDFRDACERMALLAGYDPQRVREAFRGVGEGTP
jgi:hypothetical protein